MTTTNTNKTTPRPKSRRKIFYICRFKEVGGWSKLGISSKSFGDRWGAHNKHYPPPVHIVDHKVFDLRAADAEQLETRLKGELKHIRHGEWVQVEPGMLELVVRGMIDRLGIVAKDAKPAPPTAKKKKAATAKPAATPANGEDKKAAGKRRYDELRAQGLCQKCRQPAFTKADGKPASYCRSCYNRHVVPSNSRANGQAVAK